jgi:hypothetical protein
MSAGGGGRWERLRAADHATRLVPLMMINCCIVICVHRECEMREECEDLPREDET